jgi:hypothetical protein
MLTHLPPLVLARISLVRKVRAPVGPPREVRYDVGKEEQREHVRGSEPQVPVQVQHGHIHALASLTWLQQGQGVRGGVRKKHT